MNGKGHSHTGGSDSVTTGDARPLSERIGEAALVVAHPDDEILWFSSVFMAVKRIFVCYLDVPGQSAWTAGRRAVAADYPMDNVTFLGLTESVAIYGADWRNPVVVEEGLEVRKRDGTMAAFDAELYRNNYGRLHALLENHLIDYSTVITHNPWGEYGHEEHVQVYRAVSSLSRTMGFEVWFSNYCSNRSYRLMLKSLSGFRSNVETFSTQPEAASPIETLYRSKDCWTWSFDDYRYFPQECFIPDRPANPRADMGSTLPLNFIKVEDYTAQPWSVTWRKRWRWAKRRVKSWSHSQ
jgi:LmbE family N-acetylglucosaminyl deacetylase